MTTNFKSAEEWLDDMFSKGNWVTADTVTLRGIQSNTMREAARVATERASLHSNPDFIECFESMAVALNNSAIAIEKGEYKSV